MVGRRGTQKAGRQRDGMMEQAKRERERIQQKRSFFLLAAAAASSNKSRLKYIEWMLRNGAADANDAALTARDVCSNQ